MLLVPMGAAAADFWAGFEMFPADVNDTWVLQRFSEPGSQVRVAAVTETGWVRFEGLFDTSLWLKPHGKKVFTKTTQVLYDFDAPQGTEWAVKIGGLVASVTVAEKDANVTTAFGPKTGCTAFAFVWENLSDAGVARQWFCPQIGLVKQDKITIAGIETEDTVAAAVRGTIIHGYVGQGMNVRLDRRVASAGSVLNAQLELWDTTGMPRRFRSETSQLFDLRLVNDRGQTVRLWSSDQVFLPVVTKWVLDGEKDFDAELLLVHPDGHALAPGIYTVEGWIIDDGPRPAAKTQIRVK
jgi:hypothetical protein